MKKSFVLLIAIAGVILIASVCMLSFKKPQEEEMSNITLDMGYFDKYKQIVEGDNSPKEKENAILNMAQIAIMLNDTERVVDYLKKVAMSEKIKLL